MTKKQTKKPQTHNEPRGSKPGIPAKATGKPGNRKKTFGIASILLVIAVIWFVSEYNPFGETIPSVEGLPPNTPRLTIDKDLIDYGKVDYGTIKLFSFILSNSGNDELKILQYPKIKVLKGC